MTFNAGRYRRIALCLLLTGSFLHSQMIDYQHLSLQQAIETGLKNNKSLQISHLKKEMSVTREKDLAMEKLPDIEFHTSYNQVTNLFQHQNGFFNKATKYDVINGMYDFTLSAQFRCIWAEKSGMQRKKHLLIPKFQL
ncbi:hypothetical protein ACMGDK_01475 [Chryseobacterium sp. DT-3]|uniref:hypothetical protein n=1 Tax=Chryseobacterium sp. DT-3 TaxID=3396164 RepID=UPI003F1C6E8D